MGFRKFKEKQILVFLLFLISPKIYASDSFMMEKTGEAIYRQLDMERKLQELLDKHVDKKLQIEVGRVSLIVDVLLRQQIVYRTTFP